MTQASLLREKAEMFERRAEAAADLISKQHYREMTAHYRIRGSSDLFRAAV